MTASLREGLPGFRRPGESSQVTQTATSHRRQHLVPIIKLFRQAFPEPPLRRLHGSWPLRVGKGPWAKNHGPEKQREHPELDKAEALMLRKSHETGFLSWFRNGLLATGIGVISFVQNDAGREAAYAFFVLGGICVSFGGASYLGSLLSLRRLMLLPVPSLLLNYTIVGSVVSFWLCAVSLYIGKMEVEIIHEDEEDEDQCRECRNRREQQAFRISSDGNSKGPSK
ncbi:transmembrane protein 160 [Takifugu rubripes]|uniref:transmembrane protein 160 n=1 Tax=Takifugu rubripes TaxID=31033 RepID=UPI0011455721|nr:transmembrane protein 160 [Takifugu rubripes]